jgi:hypothetical protein
MFNDAVAIIMASCGHAMFTWDIVYYEAKVRGGELKSSLIAGPKNGSLFCWWVLSHECVPAIR